MRIGIDARMYGPKQGGIGRYIEQLIKNLEQIPAPTPLCPPSGRGEGELEFVIFLRKENWDEYTPKNSRFKKVLADIPWYSWHEQILFPSILNKENLNLMHFPHWNVPLFYNRSFVVTIHDLLLLHFPTRAASALGPVSYFFKNLAYKIVLRHSARAAKKIITVSEFSKNDIHKTLGIPLEKIVVTHLAPTDSNKQIKQNTQIKQGEGGRLNLPNLLTLPNLPHLDRPYALYVGNAYPHKNLERLLDAWKIFNEKYGNNFQLVLAGREDYFYKKLPNLLTLLNLPTSAIIFTGFISDSDLPALYQNSSLYVFPSLYEGFGIPPLEAMIYNIPVAASNRASIPEILGDAAIYFNPENTAEMAETIHRGLTDKNLRQNIIKNGQNLLKKHSWENTAASTLATYKSVDK